MIFTQLELFATKIFKINKEFPQIHEDRDKYTSREELYRIWTELQKKHFPDIPDLLSFKLVWSNRHQSRCLASINLQKKVVRVAPAMKLKESYYFLSPLLYHEMCHAIVGIKVERGRRKMHTKEFKILESKNPDIFILNQWIDSGGWKKATRKAKKLLLTN